jgi:hypothetical protein
VDGGEDFAAADQLRPSETLILLLDSAVDADGAFGRRQNDLRAALDADGTVVLLVGPRIAEGLATQFGCWIRAKVGLDILPWPEPRARADGGEAYAQIRFFGSPPPSAVTIARAVSGDIAGVRYRGGDATIIVAPATGTTTPSELLRRWA